ncbi:MAG: hypothetical protein ACK4TL_09900 [Hyphomicrobiaceae bacterium]
MNILAKLFRRPTPIRDPDAFAEFIGANAAFVVQKGIYEYARARAGHYAKVLFGEAEFQRAVEESRWRAYPLGLAMVGEVATVVLQQKTDLPRQTVVREVADLVLAVFDRWEVPAALTEPEWRDLRAGLVARLDRISLHPPKRAMDIPEPFAEAYFALMPIHKSLRGQDFPTLKSYLKVTLCNVHDELTKRLDAAAIAPLLGGSRDGQS